MNWLKRKLINRSVNRTMANMTNDRKSTIVGAILGALQLANVDYVKLTEGDLTEAGKSIAAVLTAILGYYINRKDKPTY